MAYAKRNRKVTRAQRNNGAAVNGVAGQRGTSSRRQFWGESLESRVMLAGQLSVQITNLQVPSFFGGSTASVSWQVTDTVPLSGDEITDSVYLTPNAFNIGTPSGQQLVGQFNSYPAPGSNSYTNSVIVNLPPNSAGQYIEVFPNFPHSANDDNDSTNAGFAQIPSSCGSSGQVSLHVTSISESPYQAAPGGTVQLTWYDQNQGTGSVPANRYWFDQIYYSSNPTFNRADPSQVSLGTFYTSVGNSGLTPYASQFATAQVTLPATAVPGSTGYLFVLPDTYNYLNEAGYGQGVGDIGISIISSATGPDLQPQSVSAPVSAHSADTIIVNWSEFNNGNADVDSSQPWTDNIYLSPDQTLDSNAVLLDSPSESASIPAGTSASFSDTTVQIPESTSTGTYYVIVQTDVNNDLGEASVSDKTSVSNAISISGNGPDLQPQTVSAQLSANSGDTIYITWSEFNNGNVDVDFSQSWTDNFYLSPDPTLGSNAVLLDSPSESASIPVGNSGNLSDLVQIPSSTATGSYYIIVQTDANNDLSETSLTDKIGVSNAVSVTFPQPDLTVSSVSSPAAISPGQTFNVQWTDANIGTGDETSAWTDQVFISPTPTFDSSTAYALGSASFNPLAAGSSEDSGPVSVTVPTSFTSDGYILVQANYDPRGSTAPESDYDNNTTANAVHLQTNVDLEIQSIVNPSALGNQAYTVSWTGVNDGTDPTWSGGWTDAVYLSAQPGPVNPASPSPAFLANTDNFTGTLAPGQTYSASAPIYNTFGTAHIYVTVIADFNGSQPETGGPHQLQSSTVIASDYADLTVTDLNFPAVAYVGSTIDFSYSDLNQGSIPTYGSFTDDIYVSKNPTLDSSATLVGQASSYGLSNGVSAAQSIPFSTLGETSGQSYSPQAYTPGTYYVFVITDAGNTVTESDYTNNEASGSFTLGYSSADLAVSNVYVGNPNPVLNAGAQQGDIVTVYATITNIGTTSAGGPVGDSELELPAWSDAVYLSNDQRGTDSLEIGTVTDGTYALQPGQSEQVSIQATINVDEFGHEPYNPGYYSSDIFPQNTNGLWYLEFRANASETQPESDLRTDRGTYDHLGDNNVGYTPLDIEGLTVRDNYDPRIGGAFHNLLQNVQASYGQSVTLTGSVFSDYYDPTYEGTNEVVRVYLGNENQYVPIDTNGNFTATFDSAGADLRPGASYSPIYYFAGDLLYTPAIDRASTTVTIQPLATTTTVASNSYLFYHASNLDQTATLSASVSSANWPLDFGNVTFTVTGSDGVVFTATAAVSAGQASASFDVKGLPIDSYTITAQYAPGVSTYGTSDATAPNLLLVQEPIALTVLKGFVFEATSPLGAVATYPPASVTDALDAATVTYSRASGSQLPLGITPVLVTASDTHGNTVTASFNVIVRDTTPPTLQLPSSITVQAAGPSGNVVTYAAGAADLVTPAPAIQLQYSMPSGSVFPLGTTVVVVTATDAAGNSATGSFDVNVVDTTPPRLQLPSTITVEATGPSGNVVTYTASATDLVTPAPAIQLQYSVPSGSVFPLGTTVVVVTATDAAGNSATGSFDVIVKDTTPPIFVQLPNNITTEATGPGGSSINYGLAIATDAVTTNPTIHYSAPNGSVFPVGTTVVVVTATDAAGNIATASFNVVVRDTTPPVLTLPNNMTVTAYSATGAAAFLSASATDLVTASPRITYSFQPGQVFPIGVTTVKVTATDAAGNSKSGNFTVTVLSPVTISAVSVTGTKQIIGGKLVLSSAYQQTITINNSLLSAASYKFVLNGLPSQVTLSNSSGTVSGMPYYTFTKSSAATTTFVLTFSNPTAVPITYAWLLM
jgi:hypothetical protein